MWKNGGQGSNNPCFPSAGSIFLCHCHTTRLHYGEKWSVRQRVLSCKCAGCKTSYQFPIPQSAKAIKSSAHRATDCFLRRMRLRLDKMKANNWRRSDTYSTHDCTRQHTEVWQRVKQSLEDRQADRLKWDGCRLLEEPHSTWLLGLRDNLLLVCKNKM